jgi:hypothetical protein
MHRMWRRSLGEDLVQMDKGNNEEQVMLRLMNQSSHDNIEWIISFVDGGWCLCGINNGGDEMQCIRQRYNL